MIHVPTEKISVARSRKDSLLGWIRGVPEPDETAKKILGLDLVRKILAKQVNTEVFIEALETYLRAPETIKYHRVDYEISVFKDAVEVVKDAEFKAKRLLGSVELLVCEVIPSYEIDPGTLNKHWLFKDK